jgi:hypothetical protein
MGGTRISLGCLCPSNVGWRRIEAELELRLSVVALVEVVDERVVALASRHDQKLRQNINTSSAAWHIWRDAFECR